MATMKEKERSSGACSFEKTSPPSDKLSSKTPALNVKVSFEEALKLNIAIDEAVRKLNALNRSTRAGKRMGLNLTVYLKKKRITVTNRNL